MVGNIESLRPTAQTGDHQSTLSQRIFGQMQSHNDDIKNCLDARDNVDVPFINNKHVSASQFKGLVEADLRTDRIALNLDPKHRSDSDAAHIQRDQEFIAFATDLLYKNGGKNLTTDQIIALNNVIQAENTDLQNSRQDIPNEKKYMDLDMTILDHIKNHGGATPADVAAFRHYREEDRDLETKYIADDQAAVRALQQVATAFNVRNPKTP